MKYSQATQQDLRHVLKNSHSINKFRKAFYEDKTDALPTFENIYYIIEQTECNAGHPLYIIKIDEKVSWPLFKKDIQHFVKANKAFYVRLGLLNDSLRRGAGEAYIKGALPMLKSESTQLAVKAASLMNRMNYYKRMLAAPKKAAKEAVKSTV